MKILWQKVNSTDNQEQHLRHFWMAIHEVQHIFLEGGEILVSAGVLDRAGVEKVRQYAECFDGEKTSGAAHEEIIKLYEKGALEAYKNANYYLLGAAFSEAASRICFGDQDIQIIHPQPTFLAY